MAEITECLSCHETEEGWDVETGCINGTIYGPCEHEHCGGFCVDVGSCECRCHVARAVVEDENHIVRGEE